VEHSEQTIYDFLALETLRRQGHRRVIVWCTNRGCLNRRPFEVERLIARFGPGVSLVMLARRAHCTACGRWGAHVEPARPPEPGAPEAYPGHSQ
jgi:hypothetical protein